MATFYSSAFRASSGPKAETLASRRYDAFIAKTQAESELGRIVDPQVYIDAADLYLKPYSNDPQVQKKYFNAITDAKQLVAEADDLDYVKRTFEGSLDEQLLDVSSRAIQSDATADALAGGYAYYYDQAAIKLENEIDIRKRNLQKYDTLEALRSGYQEKADGYAELFNSLRGATEIDKRNYGLFVQTNPDTGKIISVKLEKVDSLNKPMSGFVETSDDYGVPVYLNTGSNGTRARLGDRTYDVVRVKDKETGTGRLMALSDESQPGAGTRGINWFGKKTPQELLKDVEEDSITRQELGSLGAAFDPTGSLPANSSVRDTNGNYYLYNQEGKLMPAQSGTLAQMFGVSEEDVKQKSFILTKNQLGNYAKAGRLESLMQGPTAPSFIGPTPTGQALPPQGEALPAVEPQAAPAAPSEDAPAIKAGFGPAKFQNTIKNITGGLTSFVNKNIFKV